MKMLLIPIMAIMASLVAVLLIERVAAARRHQSDREWWQRSMSSARSRYLNVEQITLAMHRDVESMKDDILVLQRLNRAAIRELRRVGK